MNSRLKKNVNRVFRDIGKGLDYLLNPHDTVKDINEREINNEQFHFVDYRITPHLCTDGYNRTFVTCDTPEKFDTNINSICQYKNNERVALVNITEKEYTRLKNDAYNEYKKTGHFVNKGFVENFCPDYLSTLLNPRDKTLE